MADDSAADWFTLDWRDDCIVMLDQRVLPDREVSPRQAARVYR